MPRNAAGVYTLPNPPRVPNTVIDSPDENITRDDIASELTNSLDRNGRGGMLAPFRIADGTLAAPGLAFLNEPGTGLWRQGAGVMSLAVQGANIVSFSAPLVNFAVHTSFASHLTIAGELRMNAAQSLLVPGVTSFEVRDNANTVSNLIVANNGTVTVRNVLNVSGSGPNLFNGPLAIAATPNTSQAYVQFTNQAGTYLFGVDDATGSVLGFGPFNAGIYAPANRSINFLAGGSLQLRIMPNNGATNYWGLSGTSGGRLIFFANGASASVNSAFGSKGSGSFEFFTNASVDANGNLVSGDRQFEIGHIGGAATFIIVNGSTGNTPTITTSTAASRVRFFNQSGAGPIWPLFEASGATTAYMTFSVGGGERGYFGFGANLISGTDAATMIFRCEARILFGIGNAEKGRFTDQGFFKVSNNGAYNNTAANYHERQSSINGLIWIDSNSSASPSGGQITFNNAAPNNQANQFLTCNDSVGVKFQFFSNGGIGSFSANNVNLSDAAVKDYVTPLSAVDAAQLWNAHRDVEWCSFKYIGQTHDDPNFGYLAQDIEAKFGVVMPWLVEEVNWGTDDKPKMRKSVYEEDLKNVAHAILSIAQRRIEHLEAEVATLKGLQ